jgi:hypothetical protein
MGVFKGPVVTLDGQEGLLLGKHNLRKAAKVYDTALYCNVIEPFSTVVDFCKYPKCKIYGLYALPNAKVVAFNEGVKKIWIGGLKLANRTRHIYIPASIESIEETGIPRGIIKRVTFYSTSPVVAALAQKYGAKYVECSSSQDMLALFYEAKDDTYAGVDTTGAIATLADVDTKLGGAAGTLANAIVLTATVRGYGDKADFPEMKLQPTSTPEHTDELKDAVLRTTSITQVTHRTDMDEVTTPTPNLVWLTNYLAAAMTQLYPALPIEAKVVDWEERGTIETGHYNNKKRFNFPPIIGRIFGKYGIFTGKASIRHSKLSEPTEIAYLTDNNGTVLHRFEIPENDVRSMLLQLISILKLGDEPCAILRYADKMPVMRTPQHWRRAPVEDLATELYRSFFVLCYGTKKDAKTLLLGVDLHDTNFVTGRFQRIRYITQCSKGDPTRDWYYAIDNIRDMNPKTPIEEVIAELPPSCNFVKNYRASIKR